MKSIQLLLAFWLGSHLVQVQAHAVITHSSLNEDSVIAGRATQVELHFNSKIELNLSQIVLVSMGDKKQALKSLPGGEPGIAVIMLPSLTAGNYAIQLKVFAADGHLSEELVRFTVIEGIR